jgi:DeoR/GlpR family transcriptional regulator of sugar metabolism
MFIEERHQKILQIVEEKSRVEVQELSLIFGVSSDSIRRDLRIMEEKGWVKRTYGGAVLPQKTGETASFSRRVNLNEKNKQSIAKLASLFIQDNDSILLDGSTTIAKLVPFLSDYKNLTVVTNSIAIANEIVNTVNDIKLIITGGVIQKNSANAISIESLRAIEKINVDKVFVSPCTITANEGLFSSMLEEAYIKKAMLEAGKEVYLLTDSDKFRHKSLAYIGPLRTEYTIITDSGFNKEAEFAFKEYIDKGLRIIKGA